MFVQAQQIRGLIIRLLAAAILLFGTAASAFASSEHRILYVSSYHPAFPVFFPQIDGLHAGLGELGITPDRYVLDIEFMDTKRLPHALAIDQFDRSLSLRLPYLPAYDVVIAGDDNATRFLTENRVRLFGPDVPLVFLGVNDRAFGEAQDDAPWVTGVIEALSIGETLDMMRTLDASRPNVVVISDDTPSSRSIIISVLEELTLRPWLRASFLSLEDLTFDELSGELRNPHPHSSYLLISAMQDHTGASMEFDASLQRMVAVADAPIYHLVEHGMGDGILGGTLISHTEQGRVAGHLAAQILQGTPVADLPVVMHSPNLNVVDHVVMERFGMDASALPEGTFVVNQPVDDGFVITRQQVYVLLILSVALVLFVAGVMAYTVRVNAMRAQLVEANRKAVEANRAKSEFLAAMSHELRTPLNAIIGFSQMMDQCILGPLTDPRYRGYIHDIMNSGEYLLSLINDLLDLAKIESGKVELELEPLDVAAEVDRILQLLQSNSANHGVPLAAAVASDLPRLMCDRRALHQILFNLLSNAIKFTPHGGQASVGARLNDAGGLMISVADTGIGIAAEDQTQVLEPFRQAVFSTRKGTPGTGLGLPLAKQLIELHGGHLELTSEPDVGTTVTVVFAAASVITPPKPALAAS